VLNEVILGSAFAFVIFVLSIVSLYLRFVPGYYFAAALGIWAVYAVFRLFRLGKRQTIPPEDEESRREEIAYWAGASGSSLLAPLFWILFVLQIRVF
jgi:hypothetical protein